MEIAVCDDTPSDLQFICQLLQEYYTGNTDYPLNIHSFSSALTLADFVKKNSIDIYFLDILMPGITGIEMGKYIRENDPYTPIVYITSTPDFAVQSYSVQAADYILKPFSKCAFFDLLERMDKRFRDKINKRWPIKTKSGFHAVPCNEIMYIEYQEHRLNCYLDGGQVIKSSTMRISFDEAVAELEEDDRFIKIAASFMINMCFVSKVTTKEFVMKDDKSLTITRRYKNARKTYIDFLLNGGT